MAPTNPDPTTLSSSADVFSGSYTLPQIRSLHKSLHVQIEEKSTRLRTKVGSSYRELLGTADTIVHMRSENDRVQDLLSRMGGQCGRGVISSKVTGLAKFITRDKPHSAYEAARLRLLESCGLMARRILSDGWVHGTLTAKGESLMVATKITVIGRLLVKSLREEKSSRDTQLAVDAASKALDCLRRRIQRSIERSLEKVDEHSNVEDIVKALCAHSLVNSSGARHAIQHFIRVRQRAMETALDVEQEEHTTTTQDVVHSLKLYTQTLLDVQALVPLKLAPALFKLKAQPLLADSSLSAIEELRLDMYGRWCSEEMQDFTPFVRHDDLDTKQAQEMLGGFAEKGEEVVLSGLRKTLDHITDFKSLTDLRTQVLQLWIRDGGRARGFDPQGLQDGLRETINSRLLAVVEAKAMKLRLVGSEIKATLEGWQDGVSDKNKHLWNDDGYEAALENGAVSFLHEVVSRLHGRNDAVSRASHSYNSWFHIVDEVKTLVEQLRKQRWDNDYNEIEDEETIEARQKILSKEDPKRLEEKLAEALDASFSTLEGQVQDLWEAHSKHASCAAIAIYLIRVVRDIRAQLPDRPAVRTFGLSMVPAWHAQIAAAASRSATEDLIANGLSDKSVATKPLWEGQPPLPSQPSPSVFHFLRNLSLAMSDLGVDLWTPAAVSELRTQLGEQLVRRWREEVQTLSWDDGDGKPDRKPDGTDEASENNSKAHDVCTQWLFDVALLRCCVDSGGREGAGDFAELEDEVAKGSGLDEAARKKVGKMAGDFWSRVNLLFGLLA